VNAQYLVALVHYSRAIKLFPEYSTCSCSVSLLFVVISLISPPLNVLSRRNREAVFFSNRALVYLKLNRFYESITDCTASIDRKPSIKVCTRATPPRTSFGCPIPSPTSRD